MTFQSFAAYWRASSRPMPRLAPVMSTVGASGLKAACAASGASTSAQKNGQLAKIHAVHRDDDFAELLIGFREAVRLRRSARTGRSSRSPASDVPRRARAARDPARAHSAPACPRCTDATQPRDARGSSKAAGQCGNGRGLLAETAVDEEDALVGHGARERVHIVTADGIEHEPRALAVRDAHDFARRGPALPSR